jgi:hypothetical protein
VAVAAEQGVIELVQPPARLDLEAGRQSAWQSLALDDNDVVSALGQSVRNRQAQGAGAKDGSSRQRAVARDIGGTLSG